jgi:hypothetical protein
MAIRSNHGQCHCGTCRFEVHDEPQTCYACHCSSCQTSTGSIASINVWFKKSDITLVSGATEVAAYQHNSNLLKRYYCANCATTLWYQGISNQDMFSIQGGTLSIQFEPVAHLWVSSALPWVKQLFDDANSHATVFETQPDNPEQLLELWQTA